jgi:hypothetical protein
VVGLAVVVPSGLGMEVDAIGEIAIWTCGGWACSGNTIDTCSGSLYDVGESIDSLSILYTKKMQSRKWPCSYSSCQIMHPTTPGINKDGTGAVRNGIYT